MEPATPSVTPPDRAYNNVAAPYVRAYSNWIGRFILIGLQTIQGVGSFALITLGVTLTKFGKSSAVVHPLISWQIHQAGLRHLPMIAFLAFSLGLVIIGQTVSLLTKVGAHDFIGVVMVTVVVRELGPLVTALAVLAKVGTASVIELSTKRAMGEVEALEALGIDPIHYLVMPRVIGLAVSILALTIYFILMAFAAGYLFAFVQDIALKPGEYAAQIGAALNWQDFLLLGLKTTAFGAIIATVTCYQGLAKPVRLDEVSRVTTQAVVQSVGACIILDALFIIVYLLTYD